MKNLSRIFSKPKYYFIFPVVVALLFSTSLIQVPCPVCGGTGTLTQSVGMTDIKVVSVESRILDSIQDACTNYIVTTADPVITVNNVGSETAEGYLVLHLIDLDTGETLISQNLAMKAGPNAVTTLQSKIAFAYNTIDTPTEDLEIQAEALIDNVPCLACDGTGKVSLNTYLLDKSYKDTFVTSTLNQQQYSSDQWTIINGKVVQVGSQEWMDWMELN